MLDVLVYYHTNERSASEGQVINSDGELVEEGDSLTTDEDSKQ